MKLRDLLLEGGNQDSNTQLFVDTIVSYVLHDLPAYKVAQKAAKACSTLKKDGRPDTDCLNPFMDIFGDLYGMFLKDNIKEGSTLASFLAGFGLPEDFKLGRKELISIAARLMSEMTDDIESFMEGANIDEGLTLGLDSIQKLVPDTKGSKKQDLEDLADLINKFYKDKGYNVIVKNRYLKNIDV